VSSVTKQVTNGVQQWPNIVHLVVRSGPVPLTLYNMYILQLLLNVVTKEGSQSIPSWNAPTVLECKQLYLYMDVHCLGGALHQMSAFHAFCSEWPYAVFLVFRNTLLMLLWFLVAWIPPSALAFLSQKTVAIHQLSGKQHLFKHFWFVSRMHVHLLF
jgi:hypothetical protein